MISSIANIFWTSSNVMLAVFTILLLIIIRYWTRSEHHYEPMKRIGESLRSETDSFVSGMKHISGDDTQEGMVDKKYMRESVALDHYSPTNHLDALFFAELFVASFGAGLIIKTWWWTDKSSKD